VDGDGDIDVLSASYNGDAIDWYRNDGNENFTAISISSTANGARVVVAIDLDEDGDLDVLSASEIDNTIAWHENDGAENFTEHVVSASADGVRWVISSDLDGDGDLDLLSASLDDDKIAWYENDGSENFTTHTISTAVNGAHGVSVADFDGDGDLDVVSAAHYDDKLFLHENDGSENFVTQEIATGLDSPTDVNVGDVDGDGDMDILAAVIVDDQALWYETSGGFSLNGTPTFTEGGAAVVLDADVNISDAELDALNGGLGNYDGASLTLVRNGGVNADDVFSNTGSLGTLTQGGNLVYGATTIGTVTTNSGGTLVLSFNTNATSALVDSTLQSIAYSNTSDDPPASAQIDWSFDDGNTGSQGTGGALQAVGSTTVTITAVNDAPTLAASAANDTLTENSDTTSAAVFSTVTIDPIETGDDIASAQLTIAGGIENTDTLTINGTAITGLG
ncbi:MAG: VCBS repeat-containing protein, partial [Gammaproteobacteria bacterium]|nr:VCBS repeat-containing protein [Gammaproteobacteria bacterium]